MKFPLILSFLVALTMHPACARYEKQAIEKIVRGDEDPLPVPTQRAAAPDDSLSSAKEESPEQDMSLPYAQFLTGEEGEKEPVDSLSEGEKRYYLRDAGPHETVVVGAPVLDPAVVEKVGKEMERREKCEPSWWDQLLMFFGL